MLIKSAHHSCDLLLLFLMFTCNNTVPQYKTIVLFMVHIQNQNKLKDMAHYGYLLVYIVLLLIFTSAYG
uniref:Uncharacterized protein n=1 Tax=Amphimedon queenslandica TaxID=400682 RepID=A0A1X7SHS5_AMPQE